MILTGRAAAGLPGYMYSMFVLAAAARNDNIIDAVCQMKWRNAKRAFSPL